MFNLKKTLVLFFLLTITILCQSKFFMVSADKGVHSAMLFKLRKEIVITHNAELHIHYQVKLKTSGIHDLVTQDLSQLPYLLRVQLKLYF
jgi:hypothetical protein